ncbi:epoxyqueuosine reductase QueH [Candidatus Kuenenia stuttgartiensis]|jgi:predicted adenine nucleotide alpha hydrolase (AANH) superfamily ATPase|uniref:Epoxyqueuosine reductase QueH n=1 Tax=Kuenenia stuttgartiensis TaxID=174633 RepID=Q1Q056_KUEST|nr:MULTISPECIES: epoxyqueuosine reductase QueH [Kuenenia]MBE7546531.1 epoxyqueuosine reductase QueH [Planctomycetia bacterium]MBW7941634.1 epoxyqueuosine reductase QueH [Candidatus Kuenenia stuttgartiensis]MBZ0190685.1 epoxyqueuosine reductase QueH [Candidatus Kuenenia stuttgartiensis]MCF6151460.1 epoxyqueuosine reductase QueH [Candidatus Kuenenia stuttgartiensis]MCL4726213.1 epoxyqueuosine reductase QueH [Candidatus Kuenenia stuttgartiensis]
MQLLLHICCACCLCAPLNELKKEGFAVTGFFYNPNIHPLLEFRRRIKALRVFQEKNPVKIIFNEEYGLRDFLKNVNYEGGNRCADCYAMRLDCAASYAKKHTYDAFTSTMLFSRYQDHVQLKEISERLSKEKEIPFLYRDYRYLSEHSNEIARKNMIYRQGYCGCVFSEYERYKDTTRELYKGNSLQYKENEDTSGGLPAKSGGEICHCSR